MSEDLSHLATLITDKQDLIINEWKSAASRLPGSEGLDEPLLLDHIPQLLHELSSALTKAHGISIHELDTYKSAEEHGVVRLRLGFDIQQVVAEFGLLRDVIQQFAEANTVNISGQVNRTVNRVIDKAIADSLKAYVRHQRQEIERNRQEHLSFIVHDLKTPISAILTATSVIDHTLAAASDASEVTNNMLDILRRNANGLNSRVMKIINESGHLHALTAEANQVQLEFRDVDLWPIAESLKQDCQSIASSRGNTIQNEVPHGLRICADSDLLEEVFQNLLSNALKYTVNGQVTLGGIDRTDSAMCWVRDTGEGIPPDRIHGIFGKGTRDKNRPESTGLGLALVEKVMKLHGGTVSVESAPRAGSTFRMEFPKKPCKAA